MLDPVDVCLVLMPYADIPRPSLALGLLQSCLHNAGIRCASVYANIAFAERLGWGLPDASHLERLLGEWTFAAAAFGGEITVPGGAYRSSYLPPGAHEDPRFVEALTCLREVIAPHFVDEIARAVLERGPRIVGCSSTFEQHCASLALLRRVKDLAPEVTTLIGGANCEGEMGWATVRCFPWVDFAVSGEADEIIGPLCRLLLKRGKDVEAEALPNGVFGAVHVREQTFGAGRRPIPRAVVRNVDALPVPDYSDYFAAIERSPLRSKIRPGLLVETSRGCWWGEKHHCTFCGLNGHGMAHRVKAPDRALAELDELARRHGVPRFMVVDNILDMGYLRTLLPEIARRGTPYELFFETKANLRREHVETLARAGVTWIQPGIEAFNDDLLRLMDKGSTALINLQLLKYTREVGIHTTWLLLYGFPGEDDRWHAEAAEWLPSIFHFQPPRCVGRVLYDRFSLYQQNPGRFGLRLAPHPSYERVYPLSREDLGALAYFFVDENAPERAGPGATALIRQVLVWTRLFERAVKPVLAVRDLEGALEFFDTRPCATARRHVIEGLDADVYRACDPGAEVGTLHARLGRSAPLTVEQIEASLARLVERRLVLALDGRYLSLAVPGGLPAVCGPEHFPGGGTDPLDPFASEALERFRQRMKMWARELLDGQAAA